MKNITAVIIIILLFISSTCVFAEITATEIIQKSDVVRSPNKPFRYTVTVSEFSAGSTEPGRKQILDVSMRFMKPENGKEADARSLARFVYPPRDKGKVMLSNWYDLWFYSPDLRRPIPVSRQQRLVGQISNGDVIVTNFEYAYTASLIGEENCENDLCYVLKLERKSGDVTYPAIQYWVKKANFHPYRALYLSLDNRPMKEVLYQDYRVFLERERPGKIVVKDINNISHYSVMEYSDVRLEDLPLSYFTKEYIQRGGN